MNGVTVSFDDTEISCNRPNGLVETVSWNELRAVIIDTNAAGPFSTDLYWILVGDNRGCVIPAGADGEDQLLLRLQRLPGFDNEAFIAAMSCVEVKRFLCWQRGNANKE
jgi:hypothetical protein